MIKLIYPQFWYKKNIISFFLLPFSLVYEFLGFLRKFFVKPISLESKVICVGNMTVGGAGKTQIVLWLAKKLRKEKCNFLIITKGYKSNLRGAKFVKPTDKAKDVGDESILLSKHGVVIAARNIKAALPLIKEKQPEVIIFDDGMQNPSFYKDINILVIDANRLVGNGRIFPAGPLRERIDVAINRSNIVVMVGNDVCRGSSITNDIMLSNKPFFKAQIKLNNKLDLNKKYYAFTAIGNPDRFYDLLKKNGAILADTKSFPDHHHYSDEEIDNLKNISSSKNYTLITTRKDYVKIANQEGVLCADVEIELKNDKELFDLIL